MKMYRRNIILLILVLMTIVLAFLDVYFGGVNIPFRDFLKIIMGDQINPNWQYLIFEVRFPRTITAVLAGAGLSVAGILMQTLFRNPLVGPSILGISSGAGLGVAVFLMATNTVSQLLGISAINLHQWGLVIACILGASLVLLLIMAVSAFIKDSVSLLIVGIMLSSLAGAFISILQFYSPPELVKRFDVWTFGSINGLRWPEINILLVMTSLGIILSVFLIKPLNALLMGDNYAEVLGIRIRRVRLLIIFIAGIITGTITAFAGPIAFIGLAVPHIARLLLNTSNHKILVPGVVIIGAALMLVCALLSEFPGENMILPINSVTALFGAPVVIWLILNNRKRSLNI